MRNKLRAIFKQEGVGLVCVGYVRSTAVRNKGSMSIIGWLYMLICHNLLQETEGMMRVCFLGL